MKAEKKAAEKEAKAKEQTEQKKGTDDAGSPFAFGLDEETLDPNVRFQYGLYALLFVYQTPNAMVVTYKYSNLFLSNVAILQDPLPGYPGPEGHSRGPVPTQVPCGLVTHRVH